MNHIKKQTNPKMKMVFSLKNAIVYNNNHKINLKVFKNID
jgi:hypothetical protein